MSLDFLNFMPTEGSSWAASVDWLNGFITYVAAFCTVSITAVMIFFAIKYRRRPGNEEQHTAYITHNATVETVWTVVPTLVCIFVCFYGFFVYRDMRQPPADAVEINVTGQKWNWSYKYPNGKVAATDLVVPVNTPVRLILKSNDVNHSFYLPAMRVKEDAIASEYHYLWFLPTQVGESHIFCAEYCGTSHSGMIGTLKVVSRAEYEDFVSDRKAEELSPEELGKKLYTARGCNACHSLDGTKVLGPTFKGLYGRAEKFTDGTSIEHVDENYLRESILYSTKKVVEGFQPVMPVFAEQLKDDEVAGLIAFIKTNK